MTTGKTIALTIWDFAGKVMSLFFNTVSRFFIAFLPRSKYPFNFIDAVTVHNDFGAPHPKINSVTVYTVSPSICHEVMGRDAMILVF